MHLLLGLYIVHCFNSWAWCYAADWNGRCRSCFKESWCKQLHRQFCLECYWQINSLEKANVALKRFNWQVSFHRYRIQTEFKHQPVTKCHLSKCAVLIVLNQRFSLEKMLRWRQWMKTFSLKSNLHTYYIISEHSSTHSTFPFQRTEDLCQPQCSSTEQSAVACSCHVLLPKLQFCVYVSSQGHLGAVGPRGAVGPQGPLVCQQNVRTAEMTMSQRWTVKENYLLCNWIFESL